MLGVEGGRTVNEDAWECEGALKEVGWIDERLFLTVVIVTPSPWNSAWRIFWWLRRLWLLNEENYKQRITSLRRVSWGWASINISVHTFNAFIFTCTSFWTRIYRSETEAQRHIPSSHDAANYTWSYKTFHTCGTCKSLSLLFHQVAVEKDMECFDLFAVGLVAASAGAS